MALAEERGRDRRPVIRQRLAWCHTKVEIMRYLGMRTLTQFLAGQHPGPDAAIFKLYWSEYHKLVTELGGRHPRGRCAWRRRSLAGERVPDRRPRRAERQSRRGSARSSTPGPARSTPARARCSATSSARWCSACRRSRAPTLAPGRELSSQARPACESPRSSGRAARPSLWSTARAPGGCGSTPRGWWRRPPFLPVPDRHYLALPHADAVRRPPSQSPRPTDVISYLTWCREWQDVTS